jgi:N-acetylglutamate synthase-like GNAT family acetyltransferase
MRLAKIRKASHFDVVAILDLLREYRALMPYGLLQNADDAEHVTALLSEMMAGKGIVFVAEVDKKIVGVLVAGIMPSIWSAKHLLLTEFAYFVKEEYRGGTAGYRLLAKYLEEAIKLKEEGRITNFFISKMVNSPDLNYGRFGFQKLEEFWVM